VKTILDAAVQNPGLHHSQARVDDDGVGLDGEPKDPGILRGVPEHHFLPLCVLLWEKTDVWHAVVLRNDGEHNC